MHPSLAKMLTKFWMNYITNMDEELSLDEVEAYVEASGYLFPWISYNQLNKILTNVLIYCSYWARTKPHRRLIARILRLKPSLALT